MAQSSQTQEAAPLTPEAMARNAGAAARFLRTLGNENRLMVLCSLGTGELSVSALLERVPLSQSALSQHLAVLRHEGLVDTRREAQTIHYRIADPRVLRIIPVLYELFCEPAP